MEKIGFIGLGVMGKAMAVNLLKAGYPLTVNDINPAVVEELAGLGACPAATACEVAAVSDVVISIVPDTPHVEEVVLGTGGIIEGVRPGMLYIDMSSISFSTEQKISHLLSRKQVEALDAPVSGGQPGAEQGTLSIMVGGSPAAFRRALPVFEVLGSRISYMGESGAGQITKSCNQIATALAAQGVVEALTLARKAGVDVEKVREAMLGGFAASKALEISGEKMIRRDFTPGFTIKLYRKDLGIGMQTARELMVPLPGASLVASEMDTLMAQGRGNLDFSVLIDLIGQMSALDQTL